MTIAACANAAISKALINPAGFSYFFQSGRKIFIGIFFSIAQR